MHPRFGTHGPSGTVQEGLSARRYGARSGRSHRPKTDTVGRFRRVWSKNPRLALPWGHRCRFCSPSRLHPDCTKPLRPRRWSSAHTGTRLGPDRPARRCGLRLGTSRAPRDNTRPARTPEACFRRVRGGTRIHTRRRPGKPCRLDRNAPPRTRTSRNPFPEAERQDNPSHRGIRSSKIRDAGRTRPGTPACRTSAPTLALRRDRPIPRSRQAAPCSAFRALRSPREATGNKRRQRSHPSPDRRPRSSRSTGRPGPEPGRLRESLYRSRTPSNRRRYQFPRPRSPCPPRTSLHSAHPRNRLYFDRARLVVHPLCRRHTVGPILPHPSDGGHSTPRPAPDLLQSLRPHAGNRTRGPDNRSPVGIRVGHRPEPARRDPLRPHRSDRPRRCNLRRLRNDHPKRCRGPLRCRILRPASHNRRP